MKHVSSTLVVILVLSVSVSFIMRHSQIPSLLCVSAEVYLYRLPDFSSGSIHQVSLRLVPKEIEFDNVTLVQGLNESMKTSAYWRLIIVANESASTNFRWEHEILPSSERIGDYGGVIMKSFEANGNFTLWVVLEAIYSGQEKAIYFFSERVEINIL